MDAAETSEQTSQKAPIRIFIVDDHALIRDSVRLLLQPHADLSVLGEAESGKAALEAMRLHQPDVVLMDISLPDGSGIETTARVLERWPQIKVLGLTMHEEPSYLMKMLEVGASGYVLKRSAGEELLRAIRAVAAGEPFIDTALIKPLLETFAPAQGSLVSRRERMESLSEREEQVLRCFAQGYSNKEIAMILKISGKTVETYKQRALKKMNLNSRVETVRFALEQGWLQADFSHLRKAS